MTPSLRHLQLCQEVARLGTVSEVARRFHLSQPAVTQAIVKVESYFGLTLFTRDSTGMKLTPAGEVCAPRIERVTANVRDALFELLRRNGRAVSDIEQLSSRLTNAQLNALISFTIHGSFTRAARARDVAQPTLHR